MKSLFSGLVLTLLLCGPIAAQEKAAPAKMSSAEWLARIQTDKRAIVAKGMDLTPEEAKKFWPLYEQFQKDLEVPQRAHTRAVLDFVAAEKTMTDANAKRLAEEVLGANVAEAQIQQKHFKQLLKVLPASKAARYMQIEGKMQAVQRYEAAMVIPLVP